MKRLIIYIFIALVTVAIAVFAYLYVVEKNIMQSLLESTTPVSSVAYINNNETVTMDSSAHISEIDSLTSMKNALFYDENKTGNSLIYNYYIIVGSFSKLKNAKMYDSVLSLQGFDSKIIRSDFEHFKVSIYSTENKQKALDTLNEIRLNDNLSSAWILKRRR